MQSSPEYWSHLDRLCKFIEGRLNKSFTEALADFNKVHGEIMYLYYKRDMASNMHVHIRDRVRANFAGRPWAHVLDESSSAFMLLVIGEPLGIPVIVGIKFKKQTKGLRTANIQTQAVIDFNSQQVAYLNYIPIIQAALIPGIEDKVMNPPKSCNLIAGYTPDLTWAKFARLTMIFPLGGGKVRLLTEFTQVELENTADIIPMPSQEKPKRTGKVRRRSNTKQPTRTKLRKFIAAPEVINQEAQTRKKKRNDGQGS